MQNTGCNFVCICIIYSRTEKGEGGGGKAGAVMSWQLCFGFAHTSAYIDVEQLLVLYSGESATQVSDCRPAVDTAPHCKLRFNSREPAVIVLLTKGESTLLFRVSPVMSINHTVEDVLLPSH
jgi:hypothetical protein